MDKSFLRQGGIYLVTGSLPPSSPNARATLEAKVTAALQGGVTLVQYRDKVSSKTDKLRNARLLKKLCKKHRAHLLINDDIEIALEAGADGVHLGQQDAHAANARRVLGAQAIIGVTCHDSLALAEQAVREGADYLAFGRFFPSVTKPDAPPARLSVLTEARQRFSHPLVAIGGIGHENAGQVLKAGAHWLAVVGAVWEAPDIEQAARQLKDAQASNAAQPPFS